MKKDSDMTEGVIWKEMLRFFFPVAAGTLIQQFYNAADALIVGKFVGTDALAAVGGSSATITGLMVSVFVSLACGSAVVVSQYYGAHRDSALKRATGTGIAFCLLLGAALTVICELSRYYMLRLLNTPEDIIESSSLYMGIYFLSIIFMLLTNVESGILRAVGDSRTPFIYMVISCLTNIVLDLLFVAVIPMGVAGAAWATTAAQALNAVLAGIRLIRTPGPYRIDRKYLRIDKTIFKDMMRLGVPAALQSGMYAISNMLVQAALNSFGTVVVASWSLAGKLHGIYDSVEVGMATVITTFAGQNFGAGKLSRVKEGYRTTLRIFFPSLIGSALLTLLLAKLLLPVFTDDPTVQATSLYILKFLVPFYPVGAVISLNSGCMRGCGEVRVPTIISVLCICVFRIIWIFTVCRIWNTITSVTLIYGASYSLTALALSLYFRKWSRKTLVEK